MTRPLRSTGVAGLFFLLAAILTLAVAACGGGDRSGSTWDGLLAEQGAGGPPGAAFATVTVGTAPTPAPSLPGRDALETALLYSASGYGMSPEQFQLLVDAGGDPARAEELARIQGEFDKLAGDADSQLVFDFTVANAAQERIIVRTVDMNIEVESVTSTLDAIAGIATGFGGWVVSSNQQQARDGFISLRVPASSLDSALAQIRAVAAEINSEVATSQDFTEEYTDTESRIDTLSRTLDSLRNLFDQAATVEEAIAVQREITTVQANLESLQARLSFLSQSSAFSLIKVTMTAKPVQLSVRAGDDLVIAEGRPHNFQARFTPPEGIDSYLVTWNFGDGSNERTTDRVAPTTIEGEFITSPVGHIYASEISSPFIVTVEIRGTGRAGVIEGKDTLVATVQRIPAIEVFAGENQAVNENQVVSFRGTFTRPAGITNLKAEWNFGDGSAPVVNDLADGVTVAEATHTYANYRPQAFTTTLKIYGTSPAGTAEGSGALAVQVRQPERVSTSGFDAGGTSRDAAQALANVGTALASFGIWAAILSPIWLFALGSLFFARHRITRRRG